MWAGAVWNVEYVVYGTLIVVVFGLSFAQAVPVIIIGNLFYLLTGFASLAGPGQRERRLSRSAVHHSARTVTGSRRSSTG